MWRVVSGRAFDMDKTFAKSICRTLLIVVAGCGFFSAAAGDGGSGSGKSNKEGQIDTSVLYV